MLSNSQFLLNDVLFTSRLALKERRKLPSTEYGSAGYLDTRRTYAGSDLQASGRSSPQGHNHAHNHRPIRHGRHVGRERGYSRHSYELQLGEQRRRRDGIPTKADIIPASPIHIRILHNQRGGYCQRHQDGRRLYINYAQPSITPPTVKLGNWVSLNFQTVYENSWDRPSSLLPAHTSEARSSRDESPDGICPPA
jgi:hypothetical protein